MAFPESVIEIGSTGVRLLVAELASDRKQNTEKIHRGSSRQS